MAASSSKTSTVIGQPAARDPRRRLHLAPAGRHARRAVHRHVHELTGELVVELRRRHVPPPPSRTRSMSTPPPARTRLPSRPRTAAGHGTLAQSITVNPLAVPVAGFTYSQAPGTLTFTFSDTSTNGPTSWAWTFGDGATSTSQNPVHTFASRGHLHRRADGVQRERPIVAGQPVDHRQRHGLRLGLLQPGGGVRDLGQRAGRRRLLVRGQPVRLQPDRLGRRDQPRDGRGDPGRLPAGQCPGRRPDLPVQHQQAADRWWERLCLRQRAAFGHGRLPDQGQDLRHRRGLPVGQPVLGRAPRPRSAARSRLPG